jgi:hypothetical protein
MDINIRFAFFLNMQKHKAIGFSLPNELIHRLDIEREDISRSRYLLRLLERAYCSENKEKEALSK